MGAPATDDDKPQTGADVVSEAHHTIAENAAARGETAPVDETKIAEELEQQADAEADRAEVEDGDVAEGQQGEGE